MNLHRFTLLLMAVVVAAIALSLAAQAVLE